MSSIHKSFTLALTLLFLLCLVTLPTANVKATPTTITVPTSYPTISEAIGNATNGETILIKSGTYTEQTIEINKSLTIMPEKNNRVTIDFHPPQKPENILGGTIMVYDNPITIEANNVKLSGFTIKSDGGDISANGNQIQLINNTIGNETTPIDLQLNGDGTQIISNTIAGHNQLTLTGSNQTVADNYLGSLTISGSANFITENTGGSIMLAGTRNVVSGNSLNINNYDSGYGIELNGDYNFISNNNEVGNGAGIAVGYAINTGGSYNIFAGNTVEEAGLWGILMGSGSYNVFYGNLVANCGGLGHDGYGLALGEENVESATNNLFFGNIFVNNSKNFGENWQTLGSNSFDNGKAGNYWDDYSTQHPNASEVDNSGVGNTPYLVYSNVTDNYPLMKEPNVSDAVPALPSPWSSLLSSIAVPSSTPSVPEFSMLVIVPVLLSAFLIAVAFRNRRTADLKQ
ncbi:MAG: nitrous oxide reductase family maturation protein NosD [Candidatus Bathyarchaeia archaeon]